MPLYTRGGKSRERNASITPAPVKVRAAAPSTRTRNLGHGEQKGKPGHTRTSKLSLHMRALAKVAAVRGCDGHENWHSIRSRKKRRPVHQQCDSIWRWSLRRTQRGGEQMDIMVELTACGLPRHRNRARNQPSTPLPKTRSAGIAGLLKRTPRRDALICASGNHEIKWGFKDYCRRWAGAHAGPELVRRMSEARR